MSENKLEIIVRESGLEETKAQDMLNQFQNYFAIKAGIYWEIGGRLGRSIAAREGVNPNMNLLGMMGSRDYDTLMTIAVVFGLNLGILLLVSTPIVLIWAAMKGKNNN